MNRVLMGLGLVGLSVMIRVEKSQAQAVVPDGTVGTTVTRNGNVFTITNGTPTGPNLFHSFSEFSVPTGGSAIFNSPAAIQNIFSRVTGSSATNIDGILQTSANLFLLNPNGILFGPNAQLNVGGSFIGTTAQSIKFNDGVEFSASNPTVAPLLTFSVPIGLQMGQNPGAIVNRSQTKDTTNQVVGLQLQAGKTLALIGGTVSLEKGNLTAPSGHVELAGLGSDRSASLVPIPQGWDLEIATNQPLQDVKLQTAIVRTTGAGGGRISLTGQNILLADQSKLFNNTTGNLSGAKTEVRASDRIAFDNNSGIEINVSGSGSADRVDFSAPTIAFNQSGFTSIGSNSGNLATIRVSAETMQFKSSRITTLATGSGNIGNIDLNSTGDLLFEQGGVNAINRGTGKSGNVTFQAKNFKLLGGGGNVGTAGLSKGGTFTIQAKESVWIEGGGFTSPTNGAADAGAMTINAPLVVFNNRAGIDTTTNGNGNAGPITINSDLLIVQNSSQVTTQTSDSGKGGNLNINTRELRLINGGQVSSPVRGSGTGGKVTVTADRVDLSAQLTQAEPSVFPTGIFTNVQPNATGKGGDVFVNSSFVTVRDGALISAGSSGKGRGGNVFLNVDSLTLLRGGQVIASSRDQGSAGYIEINAKNTIALSGQDSQFENRLARLSTYMSTQASNPANRYRVSEMSVSPLSGIYANATSTSTGAGGSIRLITGEVLVQDRAIISASSLGSGNAGNLEIQARTIKLDRNARLSAEINQGIGSNINLTSDLLLLRNASLITTNAENNANGGNMTLNARVIVGLENSDIAANAFRGQGGSIQITTQGIFGMKYRDSTTPENDITASSRFGINGTVQVNTVGVDPNAGLLQLPVDFVDSSQQMADPCQSNQGSRFIASGRGGVPTNPHQAIGRDRTWQDLRAPITSPSSATVPSIPALVEATKLERDRNGKVHLIAARPPKNRTLPGTCK